MAKLRFLVSLITQENDYQLEQAAAATSTAVRLGVDAQILYANNDAITQSTQILKAVQSGATLQPDGIVVEPAGGTSFPQAAKAAATAGIAWAVVNREADYMSDLRSTARTPVFSVSPDQREIGRIQARQMAALLPRGGTVLYIQGPSESSAASGRVAGLDESLPRNIRIINLKGRWTQESAFQSVSSWLRLMNSKKVSIDLIAAQNDVMAMGAKQAFQEIANESDREQWLRLPFLGVDGVPKTGQAWVRTGLLTATVIVPATTGQALALMTQALQAKTRIPERSFCELAPFPAIEALTAK